MKLVMKKIVVVLCHIVTDLLLSVLKEKGTHLSGGHKSNSLLFPQLTDWSLYGK